MLSSSTDYERFLSGASEAIDALESERMELKSSTLKTIVFIIAGLLAGGLILILHPIGIAVMVIGLFGPIIVQQIRYGDRLRQFKSMFKEKIIGKMILTINPNLDFRPQYGISKGEFKNSGLFNHKIDRYNSEDRVFGRIEKTDMQFSEIHAEYSSKDSEGNKSWHTIFKGVMFIADFHKHFTGEILVLPDTAEKYFGKWLGESLQKMNFFKGELIKMDHPAFEEEFVVYGSDQIESRYLLSPAMLHRILELKERSGKKLHLSFRESRVFVAISVFENLFEPSIWKPLDQDGSMSRFFAYLELFIGLVDELNLNTRIWTKE